MTTNFYSESVGSQITQGHIIGVWKYYLCDSMIGIREHNGKLISADTTRSAGCWL